MEKNIQSIIKDEYVQKVALGILGLTLLSGVASKTYAADEPGAYSAPNQTITSQMAVTGLVSADVSDFINTQHTDSGLEKSLEQGQSMNPVYRYAVEQANTTAHGIKLEDTLNGVSHYDRDNLSDRVQENLDNAEKNLKNTGSGLKRFFTGLLELPGDIVNGVTYGVIPSYDLDGDKVQKDTSKPKGGFFSKLFYPVKKIIGDGIAEPVDGALDAVRGSAFAVANVAQAGLDATVGNIKPVRVLTDYAMNAAYLGADLAVNAFPCGDASQRVDSMDLDKGLRGLPIVNNLYQDQHTVEHGGNHTIIQNTGFRKGVETIATVAEKILLMDYVQDSMDNGSNSSSNIQYSNDPGPMPGGSGNW